MNEGRLEIIFRAAAPSDKQGILRLLRRSLGWEDSQTHAAFIDWKHRQNPFGESPWWVAEHDGAIVGFRSFMLWEFEDQGGRVVTAARAVDTATDPEHRGQGIFRQLTLNAVADLTRSGVGFIFNTPNDQSRPGYLGMGWSTAGRARAAIRLRGLGSLPRMAAARVPAERWSVPTDAGVDAAAAFSDTSLVEALLTHERGHCLRTRRTVEYLRWRVAFEPLRYRLQVSTHGPLHGAVLFRLRRRGAAVEAAIVEIFGEGRAARPLVRDVLSGTGAEYAIAVSPPLASGLVPAPRLGPLVTTRPLARTPPQLADFCFTLGDIELF